MPDFQKRPFSIRIFIPDGNPDGLRLVEKSNWIGVGVVFNRTNYKQAVNRAELDRTGVYVLIGTSDESALPTIYVGEGDPVKVRLKQHYSNKDFWEWAVVFVAKDNSLNKAHVKHLESRLLELAKITKQCKLDNAGSSLPPTLSESETADVESFLLDVLSIFPLVGLSVFEKIETKIKPQDMLLIEAVGIKAKGYEDAKGFVVLSGSQMRKDEVPKIPSHASTLRKDLLEQGVVVEQGEHYVFTQDQVFSTPSRAACVILGNSSNGLTVWKTKEGKTLKELQSEAADQEEES